VVGGLDVWALCPRLAGTAVGGHDDLQLLTQCGTRTNRAVWYFPAVLPALVRHGLPAGECTWGRHGVDVARALIGGEIHPDILSELSLRRIWL